MYDIIFYFAMALISDIQANTIISSDSISKDICSSVFEHHDSITFVFCDDVASYVWNWSDGNQAFVIFRDLVSMNITLASRNEEDSFTTSKFNFIINDWGICAILATKCNIGFDIFKDRILLNMRTSCFDNKDPLEDWLREKRKKYTCARFLETEFLNIEQWALLSTLIPESLLYCIKVFPMILAKLFKPVICIPFFLFAEISFFSIKPSDLISSWVSERMALL